MITHHHMICIEIQPAGDAVADREDDVQGANAQARGALPFLEGDFDHVVTKQLVCICITPDWTKVEGQNA